MTTHTTIPTRTARLKSSVNGNDPWLEINKQLGELGYFNRGLVTGADGQACLIVNDPADNFEARTGIRVMRRLRIEFLPKLSKPVLLSVS
jgi:hypothetical protein